MSEATLPYPEGDGSATAGWSGSETSRERALREALDGTVGKRQRLTLRYMQERGTLGVTWKEVGMHFGWHHGQSSGVLSVLHTAGKIERLTEKRLRCQVYVLPGDVIGRELSVQRRSLSRQRAYDEGWQAGYDEAVGRGLEPSEAADPTPSATWYSDGLRDGSAEARGALGSSLLLLIDTMLAEVKGKGPIETHHNLCWQRHPACALLAVRAGIVRQVRPSP